jgi:excinuclease ABC subunit A
LGQASTTLSGGEAQRVKLASELTRRSTGNTLYLLDEPTTGLHFHDIRNLMTALLELRDAGNTIVIIEHNLDVVKMADHIIDLGPKGGDAGGSIIAQGTPEEVVKVKGSYTGKYLKAYL